LQSQKLLPLPITSKAKSHRRNKSQKKAQAYLIILMRIITINESRIWTGDNNVRLFM